MYNYAPNLSPQQIASLLRVSSMRESEIKDVHGELFVALPSVIPAGFDTAGYNGALDELTKLEPLINLYHTIFNNRNIF